jgi:hypothetical protein
MRRCEKREERRIYLSLLRDACFLCDVYTPGVGVWLVKFGVTKAQGHIYARVFLGLFNDFKQAGIGFFYARRTRRIQCALRTRRAGFAVVSFSYQTLVFRFREFCLSSWRNHTAVAARR